MTNCKGNRIEKAIILTGIRWYLAIRSATEIRRR